MIDELLRNVADGTWSPYSPIQQKDFTGNGSSVHIRVIPFEEYAQMACKRHNIDPITLYRTIQQTIHRDMLQRVNRSSIFRDKVQGVLGELGGESSLSEMFSDRVTDPFEHRDFLKEIDAVSSVCSQLRDIESNLAKEDPNLREKLITLQDTCTGCMDRMKDHKSRLSQNMNEYQPHYPDAWDDLAMKDDSYYKDKIYQGTRPGNREFANKQIGRIIPTNINRIFGNVMGLPTLMRKENRRVTSKLDEMNGSLTENLQTLQYLIGNLPESPEATETQGFLEGFIGHFFESEKPDEDEESAEEETIPSIVQQIAVGTDGDKEDDDDGDDGDDGDDDEDDEEYTDEDEENNGKKKGDATYHLGFF